MISRHHFIPFHFHKHHWNIEILEYYIYHFFYNVASSTLNLLVPIYLFELGYDLWNIVGYFAIYQIWFMIGIPFAAKIAQKLGIKHTIILRLPTSALFYVGLQYLSGSFVSDIWLLFLILGMKGFFGVTSDVANNVFIANNLLKKNNSGKNIAIAQILLVIAGVIAPLLGGLVAYFWNFSVVFNAGIVMVIFAGIPLLLTPDKHFKVNYNTKELYSYAASKTDRHFILAEVGRVVPGTLTWIMWPLFIYFIVENTANMGMLVSASALISTIIAYYVGKRVDQKNPEKVLKKAVHGATGLFFLRAFSFNPWLLGLIDIANNILTPILQIPYDFYMYRMVKNHPDQIEMSNVKQLISEGVFTLTVGALFFITYFFREFSATFFMVLFAGSAAFMLLMQLASKIKIVTEKAKS